MPETTDEDAVLVAQSLAGGREAFGLIVARYQSLICSIAYSGTGSFSRSEDLAQETFLTAWKRLGDLHEPAKLRSWLCGIARNLVRNNLRREHHQPVRMAESLESLGESAAAEPLPSDHAIIREEEAILWRSLESIPENYREPLVLFYREDQSVERVAEELELTEETVRQRLSRGRKLLQEQVLGLVEGTLRRSSPGKAFTVGVLAALPVLATSASAATLGATAAKGSVVVKSAAMVSMFTLLLGPVIGLLGGAIGGYAGIQGSLRATRTPREREHVVRLTKKLLIASLLFTVAIFSFVLLTFRGWSARPLPWIAFGVVIPLGYTVWLLITVLRSNRELLALRAEEKLLHPEMFPAEDARVLRRFREYRSETEVLGLPIIHVRFGSPSGEKLAPAVGWIAIGDRAVGVLFALGGVAAGGISIGGVSTGIISLGGASLGVLSIGGFAVGWLAVGGLAIGMLASGGFALGWVAAGGGFAAAREFAMGGLAVARHVNDSEARDFFTHWGWLDPRALASARVQSAFWGISLISFLPAVWQLWRGRKSRM